MNPFRRRISLFASAFLLFAATAGAEAVFRVNDDGSGTWTFDQPASVTSGSRVHVAFVGDAAGSGQFLLYYAAVEGRAEFTDKALTRSQVVVTPAIAIDNGSLYTDARHPQIALRSANRLVILFQAVPAGSAAGDYRLFRALVTLDGNSVIGQAVSEIVNPDLSRMSGILVDPSFKPVPADNSLRLAYTDNTTGNVYYARAGMDTASLSASPILLSSLPSSRGAKPLPRLQLDGNNDSHVVWAANNELATPTGIYYAFVKATPAGGVADALAIGATEVLYGGYRWGFPNVLVVSPTSVWIVAADQPFGASGLAGSLGITSVNPYGVTHDGSPVNVNNLGQNALFFLTPPGGTVLPPDFDAYQPEAALDSLNRAHVAGYGFRGDAPLFQGTPGRYYTMGLGNVSSSATTAAFASLITYPVSVGTGDLSFAMQIPGDYTRPAFAHFNGKAVHFWSGPDNVVSGASNIYVTSTLDAVEPAAQSGCSIAGDPGRSGEGGVPGSAVLFLPAILLLVRRTARKVLAR